MSSGERPGAPWFVGGTAPDDNRSAAATRCNHALARELPEWLGLDTSPVILPRSGRHFWIAQPNEGARERLFLEAKQHPGEPPPHWAKIWASGVALADLAQACSTDLRGQPVLELGSGLGVTAAAATDAGADLVVVDVSAQALAFCAYNVATNAGRAPQAIRANWRLREERVRIAETTQGVTFPVILAADVLYESWDIPPLLSLIDELLEPDGTLWLAEPGRKTAQRFLYTLAAKGWQGASETVTGPWPDGSSGLVNVHRLQRPTACDELWAAVGGWRV